MERRPHHIPGPLQFRDLLSRQVDLGRQGRQFHLLVDCHYLSLSPCTIPPKRALISVTPASIAASAVSRGSPVSPTETFQVQPRELRSTDREYRGTPGSGKPTNCGSVSGWITSLSISICRLLSILFDLSKIAASLARQRDVLPKVRLTYRRVPATPQLRGRPRPPP